MEFGPVTLGIFLMAIGSGLILWKKRRKFERTNVFGVEQFHSFGGKLTAKVFDGFLSWFSVIFLFSGLLILAIQYADTWGWIVLLPVILISFIAIF